MLRRRRVVKRNIARGLALGSPVAGASLATLGAWVTARRITAPGPCEDKFVTPWELGIPYEEVGFRTEDGLLLLGWWLPAPQPKRTVIALHGHRGARHHCVGIGAALWRRGANVLLFDHRGRGSSEGELMSLDYFETLDALAAVGYALSRAPGAPLGLIGYSMGAAVALMAAARDERVGAVVADSPFASERGLDRSLLRKQLGPVHLPITALTECLLPYDLGEVEPLREVATIAPRASLFVHGLLDKTCDPKDSLRLYEAAREPKKLWLLEGASHCDAYFADREAYCEKVDSFFEEHL
jgi:alpha-beta hydrolase superfamily lysophospholipase